MKISGITCSACGAAYEMAEAVSVRGSPGQEKCAICGGLLAQWHEPTLRAFRLVTPAAHRYPRVAVPPPAFEEVR